MKNIYILVYLQHRLSSGSLLPRNTVRDRDGTIGKVYRLLPQAGAGVTVYRQVGSVNALTGGHSPSPNFLPGWWCRRSCVRCRGNVASKFAVRVETEVSRPEVPSRRGSATGCRCGRRAWFRVDVVTSKSWRRLVRSLLPSVICQ